MKIAIVAAGFSPSRADELRRAMATFKKAGAIGQFKDEFIGGMLAKGYERNFAERCFSQIQGFGTYGFPESHAASFALLVYCSAWMKCYYPDVFAAAILNSQPMGFYAPGAAGARRPRAWRRGAPRRCERQRLGSYAGSASPLTPTLSPAACARGCGHVELQTRQGEFARRRTGWRGASAKHNHALRLGFRLIAGLREGDVKQIMNARTAGGPFKSPEDLMRRAKLRPGAMLTLARADAFDSLELEPPRNALACGGP